jgi:hypothetical protein
MTPIDTYYKIVTLVLVIIIGWWIFFTPTKAGVLRSLAYWTAGIAFIAAIVVGDYAVRHATVP